MTIVAQVTLPYACAGVILQGNRVVRAAPILGWSVGKNVRDLVDWARRKGGEVRILRREREDDERN
jgi:hypothetical protein